MARKKGRNNSNQHQGNYGRLGRDNYEEDGASGAPIRKKVGAYPASYVSGR